MKSAAEIYMRGAVTDDIRVDLDITNSTQETFIVKAPLFFRDGSSLTIYMIRTKKDGVYTITDKGLTFRALKLNTGLPISRTLAKLLKMYDISYDKKQGGALVKKGVETLDICRSLLEYIQGVAAVEAYNISLQL